MRKNYMETKQHGTKKKKNQWVSNEIKVETKISLETNDNGNTPIQKLWGATCVVSEGSS